MKREWPEWIARIPSSSSMLLRHRVPRRYGCRQLQICRSQKSRLESLLTLTCFFAGRVSSWSGCWSRFACWSRQGWVQRWPRARPGPQGTRNRICSGHDIRRVGRGGRGVHPLHRGGGHHGQHDNPGGNKRQALPRRKRTLESAIAQQSFDARRQVAVPAMATPVIGQRVRVAKANSVSA